MKRDVVVSSLSKVRKSPSNGAKDLAWRLEHLEAQMQKLSELVREHAEDMDRLVRIVAEDREAIRQQLLRKHHAQVRARRYIRDSSSKPGFDS
ncbi:MAG TPA: hypothetical protein VH681_10870 [Nitrospiraceae bacterium]